MNPNNRCSECEHVEIIYHCKKFVTNLKPERDYSHCPYGYNWQRGEALYTWYCPKCGNQLLATKPPEKCPECNTILGRKNVK